MLNRSGILLYPALIFALNLAGCSRGALKILKEPETFTLKVQTVTSQQEADQLMQSKRETINGLLAPKYDPYKGADSTPEKCQLKSLPKPEVKNDQKQIFLKMDFYSSKNRVLGFCNDPQNIVKTQYLMIYCAQDNSLYTLSHFYPESQEWLKEPVAHCR